jgi:hypothetical protein
MESFPPGAGYPAAGVYPDVARGVTLGAATQAPNVLMGAVKQRTPYDELMKAREEQAQVQAVEGNVFISVLDTNGRVVLRMEASRRYCWEFAIRYIMEMNLYNRIVSVVVEPPLELDPSLGGPGRAIMFDEDPVVSSRP